MMPDDFTHALVLDSRPTRGRRPAVSLVVEVDRPMVKEDLAAPLVPGGQTTLARIRATHHHLAQILANGQMSNEEAARVTGYSPSRISVLKSDPAFRELLAYYGGITETKYANVVERMAALGLHTLDELQARLDEDPEGWSKRELMDLAELLLVKGRQGIQAPTPQTAVAVQVQFIKSGTTIQGEAQSAPIDVSFG